MSGFLLKNFEAKQFMQITNAYPLSLNQNQWHLNRPPQNKRFNRHLEPDKQFGICLLKF